MKEWISDQKMDVSFYLFIQPHHVAPGILVLWALSSESVEP